MPALSRSWPWSTEIVSRRGRWDPAPVSGPPTNPTCRRRNSPGPAPRHGPGGGPGRPPLKWWDFHGEDSWWNGSFLVKFIVKWLVHEWWFMVKFIIVIRWISWWMDRWWCWNWWSSWWIGSLFVSKGWLSSTGNGWASCYGQWWWWWWPMMVHDGSWWWPMMLANQRWIDGKKNGPIHG